MTFLEAIGTYGKEITASFSCGGVTYGNDKIVSMNPHFEGGLLRTVMRCLDLELDGVSALAGRTITAPKFGVRAPGETEFHYIQYGTYRIKDEPQYSEEKRALTVEAYDKMLEAMVPYDLELDYSEGITVGGLLDAICTRLGWTKGYTTFRNSTVLLDGEKYTAEDTFRDVLDEIAQAAGAVIAFSAEDELCVLYPTASGTALDPSNLKKLTVGAKYGPINSVVLARSPQEDNIYKQDEESVTANGLTEIRIDNNQLMDSHRDDFLDGIFAALSGLTFYEYELESFGIGVIGLCETFSFSGLDGTEYPAILLADDLEITQGVKETSSFQRPAETETDYSAASETDKTLRRTILRVDKQAQEIQSLVTTTEMVREIQKTIFSQITQTKEEILSEVAEKYPTAEDVETTVSSRIDQLMDSITLSFTALQETIDANDEATREALAKYETYFRFTADGLKIGREGDELTLKIINDRISFLQSDTEVAYLSNQKLYVTDAEFLNSLQLGNFAFIPRANGNLSFRKVR